jgi:NAD(P)-dependent dehydrogenase (short-subunit alcohol dehydrogenase family)
MKHVLVTGASGGIGGQVARDLLEDGAFVGAHFFSNAAGAEALLERAPDRCHIFRADLSQAGEADRLFTSFLAWSAGRIDALVNCAGVARSVPLEELTEAALDETFAVNVRAPFLLACAALRVMKAQGAGRIVNVSSIGVAYGGSPKTAHYSASKAALEAMTRSLAKAGAPHGVLVNAVRAGVTDTAFHAKLGRDLAERVSLIPLGRAARPEEISSVVRFLLGPGSSFMTGAIVPVAGGE